jgi:iduronate 2-sulfatase
MSRRDALIIVSLCVWLCADQSVRSARGERLNVLMIAVDDLRPQLGCYGDPEIKSPAIDRLASGGVLFKRAYCQQAVCSPSRTSLLTGRRPDTTKVYDLETHFRKTIPNVVTLPEHFKQHGYHSQGLSKIYHGTLDDPQSWSVPHWKPSMPGYGKPETLESLEKKRRERASTGKQTKTRVLERDASGTPLKIDRAPILKGPAWEDPDVADNALPDGATADKAIEVLREIKGKPFFLAVGFLKPHLPFVAPKKYFDLYPSEQIKLAANPKSPLDVPDIALTNWGELRGYDDIPKTGPLADDVARRLIRGYRAATSYTDAQIGRVLEELDKLGLREKTIVVLWGDHGWQLGEHGLWCKHTNFEDATHSLLVLSAPGGKGVGQKTDALVEFVDIYPTLCELCDLPLPDGLEGRSMAPVLQSPERPWKSAAFSQYPRGKVMGYSMRTDRYRYTEWAEPGKPPVGVELYDHQSDPAENANIAAKPEHADLIKRLAGQLHAGWREASPGK